MQSATGYVLVSFMSSGHLSTCALRVADIAEALCRAVGQAFGRGLMQAAMALLVWRRIQRLRGMLLACKPQPLAAMPDRRAKGPGEDIGKSVRDVSLAMRRGGDEGRPARATVFLPRRFAWLCGLVPGEAACLAGQLRAVLAEPDMAGLLASCPQAVRVVGRLCWMLGIEQSEWQPAAGAILVARPVPSLVRAAQPVAKSDFAFAAASMAGMGWVRFIPGS